MLVGGTILPSTFSLLQVLHFPKSTAPHITAFLMCRNGRLLKYDVVKLQYYYGPRKFAYNRGNVLKEPSSSSVYTASGKFFYFVDVENTHES